MSTSTPPELYLDLLKKCLTRSIFADPYQPYRPKMAVSRWIERWLKVRQLALVRRAPFDAEARAEGRDWPHGAETMVGLRRLDNLQSCITDVVTHEVPGDLIEAGVWRGGAAIFMRAVLRAYGDRSRTVWVADSFEGLPKPDAERYPNDAGDQHWTFQELRVSLEEVKANFARYDLLDDRVRFLVGWFRDTLLPAPIERLAILRVDGDLYESTLDALRHLYPKLSVGGYAIVDDYGAVPGCRAAVEEFRRMRHITEPLVRIDWTGVFWKRLR